MLLSWCGEVDPEPPEAPWFAEDGPVLLARRGEVGPGPTEGAWRGEAGPVKATEGEADRSGKAARGPVEAGPVVEWVEAEPNDDVPSVPADGEKFGAGPWAATDCSRRGAPMGACTGAEKSSKNERSVALVTVLVNSANGNECSSNMTCLEIITRLETGSKHRYPLWWRGSLKRHTWWIGVQVCEEWWWRG